LSWPLGWKPLNKELPDTVGTPRILIRHFDSVLASCSLMPRQIQYFARLCAVALTSGFISAPTFAVVISSATDIANVKAPANDPGWLNVGEVGGGSAVYLGRGWVITAEHVEGTTFTLSDGRSFTASADYNYRVKNVGKPASPDLRMFRLTEDPGLPSMNIATTAPTVGTQVMMIGSGTDRAATLRGWNLAAVGQTVQWTETSPFGADVVGHHLVNSSTKRWGQNFVSNNSAYRTSDATQVFMTTFDREGTTFEAQATPGDSGGGVFIGSDGGWLLAGIMITSQPLIDQPAGIVTYGSQSAMADLAHYRNDILSMVNRPSWQNLSNRFDVNNNGRVESRDALAVINELIRRQDFMDLTGLRGDGLPWYDVNGDERGNPQDILAVFGEIRRLAGLPAAAPMAMPLGALAAVPEPSTVLLAVLGAAALLLARFRPLRRRA